MGKWAPPFLLAALVLWAAVSAFAQEVSRNAPDTVNSISPKKEASLGTLYMKCLAQRIHAAVNNNNESSYTCAFGYDPESSGNVDSDDLLGASVVAVADTFGKTPLGERFVEIVTRYSDAEYVKYRSDERGRLYAFGKKPTPDGEKDYRWSLRFSPASPFSAELQGTFRRSILRARFGEDKLAVGFVSQRGNHFVRGTFHLKDATVTLSGNYDREGSWFAGFSMHFKDFIFLSRIP